VAEAVEVEQEGRGLTDPQRTWGIENEGPRHPVHVDAALQAAAARKRL
jgi:hypothetical protein